MAAIKSTMEMVLERAERMAAGSGSTQSSEDVTKKGMRLAADYLNHKTKSSLSEIFNSQAPEQQKEIFNGMVQTLLRNIVIPRDEYLEANGKLAIKGLLEITPSQGDVAATCAEFSQILEQYGQHLDQTTKQLEDAIRAQLEQKLAAQGESIVDPGSINPTMHPQYQEELTKMITDLNGQYNQALEQRKDAIRQRLST